jgi:hypothetical protein
VIGMKEIGGLWKIRWNCGDELIVKLEFGAQILNPSKFEIEFRVLQLKFGNGSILKFLI